MVLVESPLAFATDVAERVRLAILEKEFRENSVVFSTSVSISVVEYSRPVSDCDTLMQKSDTVMYQAKTSGKNRICVAN